MMKRKGNLMEHDEPEQPHIHHGIEIVGLEAQDEVTNENIIIKEKDSQIQALMDNLARAKHAISYLELENKQLSDKQVLMQLELLKAKRQGDKGKISNARGRNPNHLDYKTEA